MIAKDKYGSVLVVLLVVTLLSLSSVSVLAQNGLTDAETIGTLEATVCCERTNAGLFCQDVPPEDCAEGVRQPPTACKSTSFCKPGFCFDSIEGMCLDNVPQMVCNQNSGTWSAEQPSACNLGCCVLGDQASFVTLARCKRLSSFFGLETNYNPDITDETECLFTTAAEEKGACVFEDEFELKPTCTFITRSACTPEKVFGIDATPAPHTESPVTVAARNNPGDFVPAPTTSGGTAGEGGASGTVNELTDSGEEGTDNADANGAPQLQPVSAKSVQFYSEVLCSAEELGTNCGPTQETTCLPGKEGVYFVDTCGNPANIYDASRVNDKTYWARVIDKSEACRPGDSNENSQSCGNCNYILGSYCREVGAVRPTYGENICASLNCVDDQGQVRLHGESWCAFDQTRNFVPSEARASEEGIFSEVTDTIVSEALSRLQGGGDVGLNFLSSSDTPVGSRFYRRLCNNGVIVIEPCADFRQEECIENNIDAPSGTFKQAACRVNRWQDCTTQKKRSDCVNSDQRDCRWMEGIEYVLMGGIANGSSVDGASLGGLKERVAQGINKEFKSGERDLGSCVPKIPPGLKFWEESDAAGICAQANAVCPVTFEKRLLDDEWECKKHCECLPGGELELKRAQLCMALADCGPKTNILGVKGNGKGYTVSQQDLEDDD